MTEVATESISPSAIVDPRASIGANVTVSAGAIVLGPCSVGDGCFIGTGAILDAGGGSIVMEPGSQVHASATIALPATIGRGARVQPGTVVLRDVPPHAIVAGNPAQITGYTMASSEGAPAVPAAPLAPTPGQTAADVAGVTVHRLPKILDLRGNLVVGEFGRSVPFEPKRHFMVFGVPNAEIRGEHAHRTCKQFLICVHGSCSVVADDSRTRQEFLLDDPSIGLYLPPMVWGIQYKYSPDAVLLVFASEFYDPAEYVRDYGEFLALALALAQAR